MFVPITNTPRDYAWGSASAISTLLGTAPTGAPEAELWLGAHAGSPARILNPTTVDGARTLADWIETDPATALGGHPRLPFLLKVLAAGAPLSLQAHPTAAQAQEGFARENSRGIPMDAPERNYTDPYPKPEIIYALSDQFEALCGFRPVASTLELLHALGLDSLAQRLESTSLQAVFEWLITRGDGVAPLIEQVVALAASSAAASSPKTTEIGAENASSDAEMTETGHNSVVLGHLLAAGALDTVRMLAAAYPADPGIVISLLINRVTLRRGEALYLPAGNIHAYLGGLGIELMTASDNVLRGGLTAKHIDVVELLNVLDFTPTPVPYLAAESGDGDAKLFRPVDPGFVLAHIRGTARYELAGPAIALCTAGSIAIDGATASASLLRGEAVYITPDEGLLACAGDGELFLATTAGHPSPVS